MDGITFSIHKVTSKIEFQVDDAAYIGHNYTASCSITANPRWMNLYMYISSASCDFQSEGSLRIDQYTTKATIWINNMISFCTNMTCSTNLFKEQKVLGK